MDYSSSFDDVLNMIDKIVEIASKVIPLIMKVVNYCHTKKEDSSTPTQHNDESQP